MNKKYEFVEGDTLTLASGNVLHRIRATRDILAYGVTKGDLGGYIEIEKNLPHDDSSWVFPKARVIGKDSTVRRGRVADSVIKHSTVEHSRVQSSMVRDSVVMGSEVKDSTVDHSEVWSSSVVHGTVEHSTVEDSRIKDSTVAHEQIFSGELFKNSHHCLFSNLGPKSGSLTAYRTAAGIRVTRGRFSGTLEEFEAAVNEKHGHNQYGQEYRILIEFIKKRASAWQKEGV